MNRRAFLRYPLFAATVGFAGCSALEGDGEARVAELTTEDHLDLAVGNLNVAAMAIATLESAEDPRTVDFDEDGPRARLGRAREALADAQGDGTDADADVEAVETYADVVEGTIDAVAGVLNASDRLEAIQAGVERDDLDDEAASATIDDARAHSESAVAARDEAIDARSRADANRLAALDAVFEEVSSGLETLSPYVTGVDGMATGYDEFLGGVAHLRTADARVAEDDFDGAREAFASAEATFEAADGHFAESAADTPDVLALELRRGERRSDGFRLLSTGYDTLLEAREHVIGAEDDLTAEAFDAARKALEAGNATAGDAVRCFVDGQSVLDGEFEDRFETARARASSLETLTDGYETLLDTREHFLDGEAHFTEEAYDDAAAAFDAAAAESRTAEETFEAGERDSDELFGDAFERARGHATGLEALSDGYATTIRAQRNVEAGLEHFEDGDFDAAADEFAAAATTLDRAETTFEDGRAEASDDFGDEFERALCRVSHLHTGVEHFDAAAEAGSNGDRATAKEELEQGDAALERVEDC